jgi:alcohol dehydrogenase class IV
MPPNPTFEPIRSVAEKARAAGVDCVVAVGGGSVIDAAKAVAVQVHHDVSGEELVARHDYERVLPLAAVPTTAGTGSEVTPYSIITDEAQRTKTTLSSEAIFPRLALLDAAYTMQLPYEHTAATVVDALSHAVEGRLAVRATPLSSVLAQESLRQIGACLPPLCRREELSFQQREALLYGSMLAGLVIAHSGTTIVHAMGYSLTVAKGVDHGRANGLLLAGFLRYCARERPMEVHDMLRALYVHNVDELDAVLGSLLGRIRLTADEIEVFAEKASYSGHVKNTFPEPGKEDIARLYAEATV